MNRNVAIALLALLTLVAGPRGEAAVFSSTRLFSQKITNGFYVESYAYNPSNIPIYQRGFGSEGKLMAGVTLMNVSADTDADTGVVNALNFAPFSVTPSSNQGSVSTSFTVVETPADFPNPAVTKTISGQWREIITISGVTGAAPSFASSTPDSLDPFTTVPPWFLMAGNVSLTVPSFTLTGTYQVIGPLSTTTVPFSVEFEAFSQSANFATGILGGSGFGTGFDFLPLEIGVVYKPVNPQIFDGLVDHLQFSAKFYEPSLVVNFALGNIVPEPAASVSVLAALVTVSARLRGQRARR